jgi:hypothetical protein
MNNDLADKIADVITFLLSDEDSLAKLDERATIMTATSPFTTDGKADSPSVKSTGAILTQHADNSSAWATSNFTTILSTDEAIR